LFEKSDPGLTFFTSSVPQTFEITAHKGKYQAINPAQVMMANGNQDNEA
jgi:hypothetical protein